MDTHASDHAYDALRYMIMSRPRMENPLERLRGFKRDMFKPADKILVIDNGRKRQYIFKRK